MHSEKMLASASEERKPSPEELAAIEKKNLFEDRLQAYYTLRKLKKDAYDITIGSPQQDRFIKRISHPILSDAFRQWFRQLEESHNTLIPDYLATHSEDDIIEMKDMDPIIALMESSRHHRRTLH